MNFGEFGNNLLANCTSDILRKLSSIAANEIGLVWDVQEDLKKLQDTLEIIQSVIEVAEKCQVNDKPVRHWLKRLKNIARDAEDILEEVAYDTQQRKIEGNTKIQNYFENMVSSISSLSNSVISKVTVADRIQEVNIKLIDIAKEKDTLNLKGGQGSASYDHQSGLQDRDTSPFLEDSEVFGREYEKSIIIKMMCDDSDTSKENFSVIPIVGFGGLGKTTLAQSVYNDEEVNQYNFDLKKWVCVANDSSDRTLLREVFKVICECNSALSNKNQMQQRLVQKLREKKFLIVLDDVWNSNQWDDVRILLKYGAKGSRVIVTTRIQTVAEIMGTISEYCHLKQLPEDNCWAIFKKHAFRKGGPKKTPTFEKIGREIVARCGGVPLAVKALGGLMYSKKTVAGWMSIKNNENLKNISESDIMGMLKLSYDHLPSPLKQCFEYCAIFPKDTEIMKDDLIQQWMAQGFIVSRNGDREMEEVGNDYFKTLCWNSFFQVMRVDKNSDVTNCKMHDLMHDLAQSIAGKECLLAFSRTDVTENRDIEETRHFRMVFDGENDFSIPKNLYKAGKLRTIFLYLNEANDALLSFKWVRVLHLQVEEIEEVPSSIGKLKLLQYLCLESESMKVLPQSICQLYHLETLNIKLCHNLEELPKDTWKLTNLRHLLLPDKMKMPKKFGGLCHLRTISSNLFLSEEEDGCGIGELEHLNHLSGRLSIYNMEKVRKVTHARKANLKEKHKIYYLEMKWNEEDEGDNIVDVTRKNYIEAVEALEAPPNLQELSIEGFPFLGVTMATWLGNGSLPYLIKINLERCNGLEEIPPLWHILPSLEILEISQMNSVKLLGGTCYTRSTIEPSRLKQLSLSKMEKLKEWVEAATTFPKGGLPCLEKLEIRDCLNLTLTVASFPSLKEIYLSKIYSVVVECSSAIDNHHHNHLTSLTSLHVEHVPEFTTLPEGFLQCSSEHLQSVSIHHCPKFAGFVATIRDGEGEEGLLCSTNLKQIEIKYCPNVDFVDVRGLTSLESLEIISCKRLECLPLGLQSLQALRKLWLQDIPILMLIGDDVIKGCCCWPYLQNLEVSSCGNRTIAATQLPSPRDMQIVSIESVVKESIINNQNFLTYLSIVGVNDLTTLPEGLLQSCSKHLQRLKFKHCPKFQGFIQDELQVLTSLKELCIEGCPCLTSLDVRGLVSLEELTIMDCRGIKSSPEGLQSLPPLTTFRIGGFSEELDYFPFLAIEDNNSLQCSSLCDLTIWGWSTIKSLPHQLQHLIALQNLEIRQFDALTALPEWLGNLLSLNELEIYPCENPVQLPLKKEMQHLTVRIKDCPLLTERLRLDDQEQLNIPFNYQISHDERAGTTTISLRTGFPLECPLM